MMAQVVVFSWREMHGRLLSGVGFLVEGRNSRRLINLSGGKLGLTLHGGAAVRGTGQM
jgi:hypothetical protein